MPNKHQVRFNGKNKYINRVIFAIGIFRIVDTGTWDPPCESNYAGTSLRAGQP